MRNPRDRCVGKSGLSQPEEHSAQIAPKAPNAIWAATLFLNECLVLRGEPVY